MGRISGDDGRLYAAIASGGVAEPIAFLTKWSGNFSTDKYDVTAYEDANKTYVSGKPDGQFAYNGWYDTATAQLYTAATDGIARKFYLYPDKDTAQYWFGTALFDFSVEVGVGGGVTISGSGAAASIVAKIG